MTTMTAPTETTDTALEQTAITDETLLALFHRAARFMARAHHHSGHSQHAQHRVLAILGERGTVEQRELMEMLHVRSASLSELLGKLERNGLITREKDEQDRRNFLISPTELAGTEMEGHAEREKESAGAIFAALPEEERQQLGRLLVKLVISLEDTFGEQGHCHRHHHGERHGHAMHGRGPRMMGHGCRHGREEHACHGHGGEEHPCHGHGQEHASHGHGDGEQARARHGRDGCPGNGRGFHGRGGGRHGGGGHGDREA